MAYTGSSFDTPDEFFTSGYSTDGSSITLDFATALTEVTTAESATGTGDARKVVYGIAELLFKQYAAIPAADKPTKMTISRSTSEDTSTGEFVRTYTLQLRVDAPSFEVASET